MYKTNKITVKELVSMMRVMNPGEEIGLSATEAGEYSFGIRCLPGTMFDNGMCWLADYYGGGATAAFSEIGEDPQCQLEEDVEEYLDRNDLLIHGDVSYVYVQDKDGSLPETKWSFTKTVIPPKNKLASVSFILTRSYQTHISVPPYASDDEIVELAKAALIDCTKDKFDSSVTEADAKHWDVWPEDFVAMVVNHDCKLRTNLPTGALSK